MNLLLDECIPRPFKPSLAVEGHTCSTVPEAGLAGKTNGELLLLAQRSFQVFITLDKGIPFQQNLTGFKIAILIIRATSSRLVDIFPQVPACLAALRAIKPGEVVRVGEDR
jgi:predicted nuclease of predicted toxin-antitoxin system